MESQERRAQILGHAAKLFGDKGYHDTSISDIIAAAGIARGTFYLHFTNKRGIFEELLDGMLKDLTESVVTVDTSPDAPSAREQLLDNITRVIELFSVKRHMPAILFTGAVGLDKEFDAKVNDFYEALTDEMMGSLILGRKMGLVRQCNTRIAARIALGAFKEMLHEIFHNEERKGQDPRKLAAEVLDIFSRGVLEDGVSIP